MELLWDIPDSNTTAFPWEPALSSNVQVQLINGTSVLVHCAGSTGHNPMHFLFGYGALYTLMLDAPAGLAIDHVVFHQCPHPHLNNLFRVFWEILLYEGYEREAISDETTFHVVQDPSRPVCMTNVSGNEWRHAPLFGTTLHQWNAWKRQLLRYIDHTQPELVGSLLPTNNDRQTAHSESRSSRKRSRVMDSESM